MHEQSVPQMYILALFYKDEQEIDHCIRCRVLGARIESDGRLIFFDEFEEHAISSSLYYAIWMIPYPLGDNSNKAVKLK